ncbi:class I adenylate-forming enzyme family protein [Pseudonocardia acidicola]|uniref:Long-chain fatty acid--CoA ligase n=1 Tax=Pseudonocardia acidicola TaxID=2724939 RepID=A0ABX1SL49_9PSEU|nr:AMP-binding protein [Pseudonocardia acidicola]NMI01117.1 long-chain fatty acid--CoA ligase [Pseudonocardia acidicola]
MDDTVTTTAAQVLWDAARRYPDRPCVTDLDAAGGPATLTYAQLVERVAALAGGLRARGLREGDRVALLQHNSHAYVESYLAAIAAGLVVVPLNVRLVRDDYLHMLTDSGSRLLVTTEEFVSRVPELGTVAGLDLVRVDTGHGLAGLATEGAPVAAPAPAAGGNPASLMYTSGTTGSPKAVVLSHDSWRSVADRAVEVLGMGGDEVTLHVAPLTHGAGFLLLPTLMLGGHNVLCRSYDAARTLEIFVEQGVTGLFVVPSMIRMMLDARPVGWSVPPSLRRLYYAGSPIDPETMRDATEAFEGRLVQSFAQMESPMFFTVLDQEDHRRILADPASPLVRSAGRVLPGVELRIVDDADEDLPTGEPGEILARAPQAMSGYWNRPEDTAAVLAGGWLHTGDIGHLDGDGYLHIVDRKKDMIVTGGSNVYAREVEEVLAELPAVKEAAVIGLPHRVWGEAVTAVLVPAGADRDSDAVIEACRAQLAGYRVPKQVLWVDDLPRNAYGKVLKRRLREQFTTAG